MFRVMHATSRVGFNSLKAALGLESEQLSDTLQEMGGVYSKVTQTAYIDDPENNVFDECTPVNRPALEARFAAFCAEHGFVRDDATFHASGSVGGVYAVPVGGGRRMMVKVRYPGIEDIFRADVKAMQSVASGTQGVIALDPVECARQAEQVIDAELDYTQEIASTREFACLVDGLDVVVPAVCEAYCCEDIVATEYVDSERLFDVVRRGDTTVNTTLMHSLARFLEAGWRAGKLYADPHWGNLLVETTADARLVVVDFGNIVETRAEVHYASVYRLIQAAQLLPEQPPEEPGLRLERSLAAFRRALVDEGFRAQTAEGYSDYFHALGLVHEVLVEQRGAFDPVLLERWDRLTKPGNMKPLDNVWASVFKMMNMLVHVLCKCNVPAFQVFPPP
jgi:predicted unusual protein kinase regulating ubiquinone biosynthesis (AarF/ABC1/UbiB family)